MTEGVVSGLPLLVWLSPAFPVGAFAYSHGLESAVDCDDIKDAVSLETWLRDIVAYGSIRADSILLAEAWRATTTADAVAVNALALALSPSKERHLETSTQGVAFLDAIAAAWPAAGITEFAAAIGDEPAAYPVVLGVAAAAHRLALRATVEAFALAMIGNLVSAVLRLGPIGQSDGQAIIAALCPAVATLAAAIETAGLDDLGTCAWRVDIASMRHETQYSRLFRS